VVQHVLKGYNPEFEIHAISQVLCDKNRGQWKFSCHIHFGFDPTLEGVNRANSFALVALLTNTRFATVENTPEYIFRGNGDYYEIVYRGVDLGPIKASKGLGYITHLLENPGKEFSAENLDRLVNAPSNDITTRNTNPRVDYSEMKNFTEEELVAEQLIIDDQANTEIRMRMKSIDERIEEETDFQNYEKVAELQDEKDEIVEYLKAATGLRGKPRPISDATSRAKKRIQMNISRSLKRIKKANPELYSHLEKSISPISNQISYKPDENIRWLTR
jgi:hypothetical protein